MNFGNVSDFSAKDSKEYNDSVKLFEAAGNATSEVLEEFKDTLYYQEAIPTHLKAKTHNSSHFLDEDYLSKKKMNANTSALKELTEELMFGSTEEDLDAEIIDGGVAKEIADVLAQHGITGKAVKDTFDKIQNFFGEDPDTSELAGGFEDATDDDEDSEIEDEDTSDEIDPDEVVADMEADSDSDEEPVEESRKANLNKQFLEARRMLKRNVAIKNLKKSFKENAKKTSKRNLKEALLVAPTGEFKAPMSQGRLLAGLYEAETAGHFVPGVDSDMDDDMFAVTLPSESSRAGWSVVYSISSRGSWCAAAVLVDDYSECGFMSINPFSDAEETMQELAEEGYNVTVEDLKGIKTKGCCTEDASIVFEIAPGEYFVAYYNCDTYETTEGVFFGTQEEAYEFAEGLEVSIEDEDYEDEDYDDEDYEE